MNRYHRSAIQCHIQVYTLTVIQTEMNRHHRIAFHCHRYKL